MKKIQNARNLVIVILCITIICLGVGFTVLAIRLNSITNEDNSFNVSIVKVDKMSFIKGGKIEPVSTAKILDSHKELELNFTLNTYHDEVVYVATIRNNGTLNAKISSVFISPDYSSDITKKSIYPVTITINDINNKILEPKEETELRITANYSGDLGVPKKIDVPIKIGIISESV